MRSQPDASNWAVNEFADAELGDLRRTKRLVELAHVLAQHPIAALPEACGDGAMLKAAYRFFSNDDIKPQDCLDSHIESTYARLALVPLVLAVHDTTEVDWTGHPICIKLRYLTCSHGFKPRARPPYRAHIHQAVGDSCGVAFFAYTATWGALA